MSWIAFDYGRRYMRDDGVVARRRWLRWRITVPAALVTEGLADPTIVALREIVRRRFKTSIEACNAIDRMLPVREHGFTAFDVLDRLKRDQARRAGLGR